jgi:hypothetical protein
MDISHANPTGWVDQDTANRQRLRLTEHRGTKQDDPC